MLHRGGSAKKPRKQDVARQGMGACREGLTENIHEQSIQEMLRKARQQQKHNRKAKQHNTTRPKQSFFKEEWAASGGTRTHDHQLAR